MKKIFFFIFFHFQFLYSSAINKADQKLIDSLLNVVNTSKDDTLVIKNLNRLSRKYNDMGDFDQALICSDKAKQKSKLVNFNKGLASAYLNATNVFVNKGDYSKAMSEVIIALEISEKIDNKPGIGAAYNSIGNIYSSQNNQELAMVYYQKCLTIREKLNDITGMAACYNNMGILYRKKDSLEKALNNYFKCLYLLEEDAKKGNTKFTQGISSAYNNIGLIYKDQGKYELAIENSKKAYEIRIQANDQKGCASTCNNLGEIYTLKNDYETALIYLNKALVINTKIGAKLGLHETYLYLSDLYYKKQEYKKAFEYQALCAKIKDQIFNEKLNKQITEINVKYDSEKKDRDLIQKDAEIKIQEAEASAKELERNSFIVGFVLLLIVAIVIFIGYTNKKSVNMALSNKNELVETQKKIVDEKNKSITSSINYAKRIQKAVIPSEEKFKTILPSSFILFKPKDVVSGDFYWISKIANDNVESNTVLLAVGDCVGHGVPGALMSLMTYNLLEQIVKERKVLKPSLVLDDISATLKKLLLDNGDETTVKSGLDIAMCNIDFKKKVLNFAGAQNSLYLIRNGVLIEHKADKRSIPNKFNSMSFTNHEISVLKDDIIYLFTDGYADQKGGPENKKLFYKPFQDLLMSISHLPLNEQKKELDSFFINWRGTNEQIDDVLIVGFKIE